MALRGVDNRSPEAAYVTKNNIVYPGTQAQADEVERLARVKDTEQGTVNGPNSAALAASGTTTTIERNTLTAG